MVRNQIKGQALFQSPSRTHNAIPYNFP
ncbi:uncharacterized protein METZ01_LOCUS443371, partial [marine metagenome]